MFSIQASMLVLQLTLIQYHKSQKGQSEQTNLNAYLHPTTSTSIKANYWYIQPNLNAYLHPTTSTSIKANYFIYTQRIRIFHSLKPHNKIHFPIELRVWKFWKNNHTKGLLVYFKGCGPGRQCLPHEVLALTKTKFHGI